MDQRTIFADCIAGEAFDVNPISQSRNLSVMVTDAESGTNVEGWV